MIYRFSLDGEIYSLNLEEVDGQTQVEIEEEIIPVEFEKIDDYLYSLIIDGKSVTAGVMKKGKKVEVFLDGELYEFEIVSGRDVKKRASAAISGVYEVKAPMPSKVVKLLKREGEGVREGEGMVVVEAMKMESELKSPIVGKVTEVKVEEGDAVESGTVLLIISSE